MTESMMKAMERVESEICTLTNKNPMNMQDVEMLYKLVDVAKDLSTIHAMDEYLDADFNDRYSSESYARMPRVSYNGSYERGRSPSTGRFVSRRYDASMRNSMNDGYSAHSIKDRMIDSLERLMDNAATEYEREEIRREIEGIRKDK